jgi:PIN domain nuclease of toxin-antitoxin system
LRILLDTSTFLFAVSNLSRLSRRAKAILESDEDLLELSAISLTEIAVKTQVGKLNLSPEAVEKGIGDLMMRYLPYTAKHAYEMFGLPLHHSDPFDRQIIAQALSEDIPVLTSDEKFRLYKGLKVIW